MEYSATCKCGDIKIIASFPSSIEEYQARECDCDFCISHGLAYLSDVNGTIAFSPKSHMNQLKQGSEQATFWQCSRCKQVVVVTSTKNGETRGAVSKTVFEKDFSLKASVNVSPKRFSPKDKAERWPTVWSKVISMVSEC
ncbi:aldehyde-activating protein [Alteromonas sp. a30]|uniref:aldehyde-activating protein n=1 Tax=Alteromonas sp. a30 TaxID=2730917 RepID=UPI00227E8155|nr:aldehyde-activating protein [Alteromonas sp. a30]MCY7297270.1 aldehyde-activating protein [Alteromonas sp. a30]